VADEVDIADSASGPDAAALVFERWRLVEYGEVVGSDYCRLAWLPVLGPAAWLLWDSVTRELEKESRVEWSIPEIARFHGIGCADVIAAVEQLAHYGLAASLAPTRWRVRLRCPTVLAGTNGHTPVEPPAEMVQERRPQLWSSRHRPTPSRRSR
jgi:hypothetical protein